MINFTKGLLCILFSLFCLYILESACFRLIENYANWRLTLAWGKPSEAAFNSILKKLPLDHFVRRPTDLPKPQHLGYWVGEEDQYSSKVMSFTRPTRDIYENYIQTVFEPLANYEIRDYEEIQGVVLPGLKKSATVVDVQKQKARRVGDPMEYAHGVFVKVVLRDSSGSYKEQNAELESSFGFMLQQGFACVVLPVFSSTDLIEKIENFKKKESLLARNIYAWADGNTATILLKSCQIKPSCWQAIMITDPDDFIPPPTDVKLPWMYFEIDDDRRLEEEGLDHLYQWINLARSNENIYVSRLAGLVRISQNFYLNKSIPSSFASYVINCSRFMKDISYDFIKPQNFAPVDESIQSNLIPENELVETTENFQELNNFDLGRIENSISVLEKQEEINPLDNRPSFDCEIIKEYRQINSDDPKLKLVSNRDLILKLGLGFDEMGQGVLGQIKTKDPLFYRYYISLRAIEESPLN